MKYIIPILVGLVVVVGLSFAMGFFFGAIACLLGVLIEMTEYNFVPFVLCGCFLGGVIGLVMGGRIFYKLITE